MFYQVQNVHVYVRASWLDEPVRVSVKEAAGAWTQSSLDQGTRTLGNMKETRTKH